VARVEGDTGVDDDFFLKRDRDAVENRNPKTDGSHSGLTLFKNSGRESY
jgi:hypothetical protein